MKDLSLIIPARNEAATLERMVKKLKSRLEHLDFELIIVEAGCRDKTEKIAERLSSRTENIRHLHFEEAKGKGKAVERGLEAAEAEKLGFIDADLSIKPEEVAKLYSHLKNQDIVIGSRYTKDAETDRKTFRLGYSKLYNFLARKILGTGFRDHQCGVKLFNKEVWESLEFEEPGWFWDTKFLNLASKKGFSIREEGIKWEEKGDSSINVMVAAPKMLEKLVALKMSENKIPFDVKYFRFAAVGAAGATLNTAILYLLTDLFNLYYLASSVVAIETAIIFMFFLNNSFTFEKTKKGKELVKGLIRSNLVRSIGIATNISLLYVFTETLGIYYIFSNLLAIFLASIVNFLGEKHFNWQENS